MELLWLVPMLPLAGAFLLALFGGLLPRKVAGLIGCLSVGLSAVISFWVAWHYLTGSDVDAFIYMWRSEYGNLPAPVGFHQVLYQWIGLGSLKLTLGLQLDPLSATMMLIVTCVGFLIHLYSAEYMWHREGYSRYFCYLNLFVAAMLILLLGDNFVVLYLGWEGVGICSYLLIGFWYQARANGLAAQKAFIVTRIGDTSLAIGLFLIFFHFRTLDIQQVMNSFATQSSALSVLAFIVGLLIIGGAVGKSAQLPLQTWLPDAMAGPTPVSALIHAATMVTAGVYLIARTHVIFAAAPAAMLVVAIIGVATAIYGGFSALAQRDLKKILAYSTISQIGYMFLALGVGAWWAAIFHFVTHAFFKALLFLSAGIVLHAQNEERDIYKLGGLFRRLPVAGWTFLIGAASLSALPLVTAGFYSKDAIIADAWTSQYGSAALWACAVFTAFLTGLYAFRAFFITFFGEPQKEIEHRPGLLMSLPVVVLAFFAVTAGFIGMPASLGGFNPIGHLLARVFGPPPQHVTESTLIILASPLVSLLGIALAYHLFLRLRGREPALAQSAGFTALRNYFAAGWGFDWLYQQLFVRPYVFLARLNRGDFVDAFYTGLAWSAAGVSRALSFTESGRVRNYATGILLGAAFLLAFLLLR